MFFRVVLLVLLFDVLFWWRADRLLRPLGRARLWRMLLGLFMAGQLGCVAWILFGRMVAGGPGGPGVMPIVTATYLWHMLVQLPAVLVLIGLDLARGVAALARFLARRRAKPFDVEQAAPGSPAAEASPTRRQLLGGAVAAAPPLVTVIGTAIATRQLDEFRHRRITLPVAGLPRDLDGLKIAHVSDIHVGSFTNGRTLTRIVEATNDLRADLVLLTGDLINVSLSDLSAGLDMVRKMDARAGLFMCEGNHDLIESRQEFESRTRRSGVPILINESAVVRARGHDVQLLGLRWGSGRRSASRMQHRADGAIAGSIEELKPLLRPDAFPILLAHHPHAFDFAAEAGIPLTLSGHTHGGQLMLSDSIGFGPAMYRYWSGAYSKNQNKHHAVISNGVGNWFPLRINAPAEIISITLSRANG